METGTEILIARMASHPEEFVEGATKWAQVMSMAECLSAEDKQALRKAYDRAKIEHFNGEVLATLAGEREPTMLGTADTKYGRYATGLTDPRGLVSISNGGNGTLSTTVYNPAQGRPV
jgi:hypothetical protein